MELMQALRRLADLDDEWDDNARRFQHVRSRLGDDTPLQQRRSEQHAREEKLGSLRSRLNDLELEMASLQERARQVEHDLYNGSVLAPRELENLRRDGESLKRRLGQLEDQALEIMARIEDLAPLVELGAQELALFEQAWDQEMAAAREEYAALRSRLEALKAERDSVRESVPQRELALYDELRRTKGGRPLAPMVDRVCQVCGVTVPTHKATIAEGGADTVATCEGCGRILYQP